MNEKIDWMLGMTENMMNMTMQQIDKPMMKEMYAMTSAMMGNLNHMKLMGMDSDMMCMMEQMMRSMEQTMMGMDMNSDMQKMMLKNMMNYMLMMQMSMIMKNMSMK